LKVLLKSNFSLKDLGKIEALEMLTLEIPKQMVDLEILVKNVKSFSEKLSNSYEDENLDIVRGDLESVLDEMKRVIPKYTEFCTIYGRMYDNKSIKKYTDDLRSCFNKFVEAKKNIAIDIEELEELFYSFECEFEDFQGYLVDPDGMGELYRSLGRKMGKA